MRCSIAVLAASGAHRVYARSTPSLSTGRARQRNRLGGVRFADGPAGKTRQRPAARTVCRGVSRCASYSDDGSCHVARRMPRVMPGGRADDPAEDYEQAAALPDRLSRAAQARAARAAAEEGAFVARLEVYVVGLTVAWSGGMLLDA